ncbi:MAG: retron system putative HNH endonuclease [Bacteroidia bacterium]|nr:retron system putative HNH endonuclease [Bacteroidia bacterium]
MKHIVKSTEPPTFAAWKTTHAAHIASIGNDARALWDYWGQHHGGAKNDLKHQLLDDQGFICCYCMQGIQHDPNTSIEHVEPKSSDPQALAFDWNNLLAACNGSRPDPQPRELICDAEKGNQFIKVSPLHVTCESQFEFKQLDGAISGKTTDAVDTIAILNLNASKLKRLRSAVIAQELEETTDPVVAASRIPALLTKSSTGRFSPFCLALISFLKFEFNLP